MSRCMLAQFVCCRSRFGASAAAANGGSLLVASAVFGTKTVLRTINGTDVPASQHRQLSHGHGRALQSRSPSPRVPAIRRTVASDSKSPAHSAHSNATTSNAGSPPSGLQRSAHAPTTSATTLLVQQPDCGQMHELPVFVRTIGHSDDILSGRERCAIAVHPTIATIDVDAVIGRLQDRHDAHTVLAFFGALRPDERVPEVLNAVLFRTLQLLNVDQLDGLESDDSGPDALAFDELVRSALRVCDAQSLLNLMAIVPQRSADTPTEKSRPPKHVRSPPMSHVGEQPPPFAAAIAPNTLRRLCDELLLRSTHGCLDVIDVSECVQRFDMCGQRDAAEKCWSALSDQAGTIDEHNIRFVYQILGNLRVSRRMVLGILERRIRIVYGRLQASTVVDIVHSLRTIRDGQPVGGIGAARTLQMLSRWLHANVHTIGERQLLDIVRAFTALDYNDEPFVRAVERFARLRCAQLTEPDTVCALLEHVQRFRVRSAALLDAVAAFCVANEQRLDARTLRTVAVTFGQFGWQPAQAVPFWVAFERQLERRYDEFAPGAIVDVMLACVQLLRWPLNFTGRIFTPYFLERMTEQAVTGTVEAHARMRANLKLFDTAMTLECREYGGPMLPRDRSAKSLWHDERVRKAVQSLETVCLELVDGDTRRFGRHLVDHRLPYDALYVCDVLLQPADGIDVQRSGYAGCTALLVHLPEHYDASGTHLCGAQTMRVRHLRLLGIRVVGLKFDQIMKLRAAKEKELRQYVAEQMRSVLPAIA